MWRNSFWTWWGTKERLRHWSGIDFSCVDYWPLCTALEVFFCGFPSRRVHCRVVIIRGEPSYFSRFASTIEDDGSDS